MRKLFALLLFFVLVSGCSSGPKTEGADAQAEAMRQIAAEDSLWSVVMDIHDEVMPEMTDINRAMEDLESRMKQSGLDPAERADINQMMGALERADNGMWDWMNNLNKLPDLRRDSLTHDTIMHILKIEQREIEQVRDDMRNSIKEAQTYLSNQQ